MSDTNPTLRVLKVTQAGAKGPWLACHGFTTLDEPEARRTERLRSEAADFIVDHADGSGWISSGDAPEALRAGVRVALMNTGDVWMRGGGQLCRSRQGLREAVETRLPKVTDGTRLELRDAVDEADGLTCVEDVLRPSEIEALGEFDGF